MAAGAGRRAGRGGPGRPVGGRGRRAGAGSGENCPSYQRSFTEHRERLRAAGEREPPAAAVTWMLSAEYAEERLPGGGTWPLLVLMAVLDSHGIPLPVLAGPAACRYLAGTG